MRHLLAIGGRRDWIVLSGEHQRGQIADNRLLLRGRQGLHLPELADVVLLLLVLAKDRRDLRRDALHRSGNILLRQEWPVFTALGGIEHTVTEGIVIDKRAVDAREELVIVCLD